MGVRRSTPPCKPNATAHEPSRKTLAAFACERSTGAATLLRLRQTLGLGLGVADDLRSISRSSACLSMTICKIWSNQWTSEGGTMSGCGNREAALRADATAWRDRIIADAEKR